jgi:hypothetical protein
VNYASDECDSQDGVGHEVDHGCDTVPFTDVQLLNGKDNENTATWDFKAETYQVLFHSCRSSDAQVGTIDESDSVQQAHDGQESPINPPPGKHVEVRAVRK